MSLLTIIKVKKERVIAKKLWFLSFFGRLLEKWDKRKVDKTNKRKVDKSKKLGFYLPRFFLFFTSKTVS